MRILLRGTVWLLDTFFASPGQAPPPSPQQTAHDHNAVIAMPRGRVKISVKQEADPGLLSPEFGISVSNGSQKWEKSGNMLVSKMVFWHKQLVFWAHRLLFHILPMFFHISLPHTSRYLLEKGCRRFPTCLCFFHFIVNGEQDQISCSLCSTV